MAYRTKGVKLLPASRNPHTIFYSSGWGELQTVDIPCMHVFLPARLRPDLRIVKSRRDGDWECQQVIATLGQLDPLHASSVRLPLSCVICCDCSTPHADRYAAASRPQQQAGSLPNSYALIVRIMGSSTRPGASASQFAQLSVLHSITRCRLRPCAQRFSWLTHSRTCRVGFVVGVGIGRATLPPGDLLSHTRTGLFTDWIAPTLLVPSSTS